MQTEPRGSTGDGAKRRAGAPQAAGGAAAEPTRAERRCLADAVAELGQESTDDGDALRGVLDGVERAGDGAHRTGDLVSGALDRVERAGREPTDDTADRLGARLHGIERTV